MKIIKEHINEKFTEDSDPVHDLGIGIEHQIKKWLKEINYEKLKGDDVFALCAEYGKLEFVKYLLEKGANVNHTRSYALRYASNNGHTKVVKVLLDAGADIHADDDSALRWASLNGHEKVVKILLDAGADVFMDNKIALKYAKENGRTEVVKILEDHIKKEEQKFKKSIYEKFTDENSDPITDMGIGGYSFETLRKGAVIKSKRLGIAVTRNNSGQFTSWIYGFKLPPTCDILVINVSSYIYNKKEYKRIYFCKCYNKQDLIDSIESLKQGRLPKLGAYNTMIVSKKMFDNRFEVIERGF